MLTEKLASILKNENIPSKLSLPSASSRFLDLRKVEHHISKSSDDTQFKELPFARSEQLKVPIKDAKILFEGENVKRVLEVILDLGDSQIDFGPGDTIGIIPHNLTDEVETILCSLGLISVADENHEIIIIEGTKKKTAKMPTYLPKICTIRHLLENYLNIRAIPKKLFIRALLDHTTDNLEKKFLEILCSKEGSHLYNKCVEEKFSFLDILKLCTSCCPPFGVLLEHLPRLLPRPYSVVNSPLKNESEVKIIFSVLEHPNTGLTTSIVYSKCCDFFSDKNNPSFINIYFRRKTKFKFTLEDFDKNVVLIGVGVGVAPFIGFLEHQDELRKLNPNKTKGQTWLFTGSRFKENSLYREQFKTYLHDGIIQELHESFSRELDYQFKHVQDNIQMNSEQFVNFVLLHNTVIYVCADGSSISKDIEKCITECIQNVLDVPNDEAKQIVMNMKNDSKYLEDVWQ